jgi:thioredoxin-dependent peroxiredoxin
MALATLHQPLMDYILPATSERNIALSDFKGKNLVLYFYPKDCTSGCTREGQDFRDAYAQFKALHTEILGVSRDTLKLHEKFKAEENFPFELLSDAKEQLCQYFNVIKDKKMYGKPVRGIERSTFLIDAHGILVHEWRGVKVEGHVAEVLKAIKDL